jgi:hypothetical protein
MKWTFESVEEVKMRNEVLNFYKIEKSIKISFILRISMHLGENCSIIGKDKVKIRRRRRHFFFFFWKSLTITVKQ